MAALTLTAFFAAMAALALLSLRHSWKRYGQAALDLRAQLRACDEWREVTVTLREVTIHPAGATILRPDFRNRERFRPAPALPAAA